MKNNDEDNDTLSDVEDKVKNITYNFNIITIAPEDIQAIQHHARKVIKEQYNHIHAKPEAKARIIKAKSVAEGNRNRPHRDARGRLIKVGDEVTVLNNGKIGKTGDAATVIKLSPDRRVIFKLLVSKEEGQRVSTNLKLVSPIYL